jgi:hypothetical protein
MKTTKLAIPISLTAALVSLIACGMGCAKKNNAPETPVSPPEPVPTNTVPSNTTNAAASANAPVANIETNAAVTNVTVAVPQEITNPPPVETTTTAPMTETNLPGHAEVVEMPTNAPVAPTNFYPAAIITNNNVAMLAPIGEEAGSTNFFLTLRAGYEHINHGDNNDSYRVSAKFYAYGDGLRESAGKNGWFIPDADAEISSGEVAKPDYHPHSGSDSGLQFRAAFTWPWFHWTMLQSAQADSVCPFCQPLAFTLGPTMNIGFDHLYDESKFRFAHYTGLRLTYNRSGFIEYTVGDTIGLAGTRQQIVAEIPFYQSRDGEVRYYLRGLWNRGDSTKPDILEGGVFLEMPFATLVKPDKWGDLVPFAQ